MITWSVVEPERLAASGGPSVACRASKASGMAASVRTALAGEAATKRAEAKRHEAEEDARHEEHRDQSRPQRPPHLPIGAAAEEVPNSEQRLRRVTRGRPAVGHAAAHAGYGHGDLGSEAIVGIPREDRLGRGLHLRQV